VSTIGGLNAQLGSQGLLLGDQEVKGAYLQRQLANAAHSASQAEKNARTVLDAVRSESARFKAASGAAEARVEGLLADTQALQLERIELTASEVGVLHAAAMHSPRAGVAAKHSWGRLHAAGVAAGVACMQAHRLPLSTLGVPPAHARTHARRHARRQRRAAWRPPTRSFPLCRIGWPQSRR
jgi:hypothetical protein